MTLSVGGDTATVPDDFAAVDDFTLTIVAGEHGGAAVFTLYPVADDIDEEDETLTVTGTTSPGIAVEPPELTVTIVDGDAPPDVTLSLDPDGVPEDAGPEARVITVTATLDGPTHTIGTVVTLSVGGDTATVPDDLAAVDNFALTIVAGERGGAAVFTLYPVADDIDEEDETLTVTGTASPGIAVEPPELTVTIVDGDAPPDVTLSLDPDGVPEDAGPEGGVITVTATLDGPTRTIDTVVTLSVGGDTATVPDDLAAVDNFALTIVAGERGGAAVFTLYPVADDIDEEDETLTVTGTASPGIAVEPPELTVTIVDGDAPPDVTLSLDPDGVPEDAGPEGGVITVTATLDGPTRTIDTVVTLSVGGDTATVPHDFAAVDDFTLTIVAGERSGAAVFTLYPVADDIDEENETLTVTGTTSPGIAVEPPELTVTIVDGDAPQDVTLSLDPDGVPEDAGPEARSSR